MYTVLLIDDNLLALEALEKTVDWTGLGLIPISKALNGRQGIDQIRRLHPDIILSDIQMPEMSGLEMVELLQDELQGTKVIFITAYEKIEYASRAIKLSAFDFLLKPLNNEELENSLRRAIKSLDKERSDEQKSDKLKQTLRRSRLLIALTQGVSGAGRETFLGFLEQYPEDYFIVVAEAPGGIANHVLQRLDFLDFPENTEVVSTVIDSELVLFCSLHGDAAGENWQVTARRIGELLTDSLLDVTVGISNAAREATAIRSTYKEAMQALLQRNLYGRHGEVAFYNTPILNAEKRTRIQEMEQLCSRLAQNADELDASQIWDEIGKKSEGRIRLIRIMLMFFCTKLMQAKSGSPGWAEKMDMTVYDLTRLKTTEDAHSWFIDFFSQLQKSQPPVNSLVQSVLEYIRENVTGGLVLEEVAAHFYISPNYLSSLIRKETGVTYRQHVIVAKIDMAKHLLEDTRMRVEEIAYAIGYENYISFYNTFKKIENMSPTEYRYNKYNP